MTLGRDEQISETEFPICVRCAGLHIEEHFAALTSPTYRDVLIGRLVALATEVGGKEPNVASVLYFLGSALARGDERELAEMCAAYSEGKCSPEFDWGDDVLVKV